MQTVCFHTTDAVQKSFTTLKNFLCPNDKQQSTTLHVHRGEENAFLAQHKLNSTNLQHQNEDNLTSLCDACAKVTGKKCQKNKNAIKCWVCNGFIGVLNPAFDRVVSLQNSTAMHMCIADTVAILTLAENRPGGGKEMP